MASPVVEQAVESSTNTAGTSHTVTLPTATAGQLLLIILDKGSTSATINAHGSLTELLDEASANGLYIAYRWMDGSEPASYTLTSSANTRSAVIAYRISGAVNPAAVAPQIGTTGSGTSATPDPPASATPPSSKDYLFIAFAGMAGEEADDDTWGNTPPTNYTPSPPRQKSCGTAGTNLGGLILSAERALTTGSAEDPGTFGVDTSAAWRSQTITIHPPLNTTVTPTTASLTLTTTGLEPTVTVTNNQLLIPSTASLATSAFAPTVATPALVTPTTATLRLSEYERLLPDGIVSASGFAGAVLAEMQTEDADTAAATSTTAAIRLSFPTPVTTPSSGAISRLEALIFAGTSDTTAAVDYHQSGSLVIGSGNVNVPANTSAVVGVDIPNALLTDLAGGQARISLNVVGSGIDVVRWMVNSGLPPTVTASDNQTVTPTTLSLISTTFDPTVTASANQTAVPTTASLVTATFAPSVTATDHQLATPTTASLISTTFDPTVTATAHQTAIPPTASLTLATFAPTVTGGQGLTVTPSTASLSLSTFAPTVALSDNQLVIPGPAAISLITFEPLILIPQTITIPAASLTLTTFAPRIGTVLPIPRGSSIALTVPATASAALAVPAAEEAGLTVPEHDVAEVA